MTAVDGLYQEDAATPTVFEPAVQPDVPKPEEASTQALSSATLHPFMQLFDYEDVCCKFPSFM